MRLRDLLRDVEYELVQGNLDLEIKDIAYNSKNVSEGVLFVALKGFRVDGHQYIESAIENGAKCIVVSDDVIVDKAITVIKLEDTRTDLSKLSRTFFGYPDKEMTTVAITGTKGKTTISTMIKKVLDDAGNEAGLIGTMGVFYKDKFYHTMNTSPEAYEVFKYMREMLDNGVRYLVMEISSQSLKLKRWSNVIFDYAVFTNLSLDHVGEDEHDSFLDYKYCKSLLFKQCRQALVNVDSEYWQDMIENTSCDVAFYGKEGADYRILGAVNVIEKGFAGIRLKLGGKINREFMVSIPGLFTAYNATAAIGICDSLGIKVEDIAKSLENVSVKGRMESVLVSNKFSVLIDYAYQGIAMENVLATMKEAKPKRIVTVFGCGGNRSKQRRYDCGEVSGKYSDLSIITADNPRYEKNEDIVKDIMIGMNKTSGKYIVIDDRKSAIKEAIVNAKEGDVILILGKGHEDYQEIEGVRHPFDERVIIKEIIDELDEADRLRLGIIG